MTKFEVIEAIFLNIGRAFMSIAALCAIFLILGTIVLMINDRKLNVFTDKDRIIETSCLTFLYSVLILFVGMILWVFFINYW